MIAKKSDVTNLRKDLDVRSRINTAPGVRVTRTTRGQTVRTYATKNQGGGKGFVPKWG